MIQGIDKLDRELRRVRRPRRATVTPAPGVPPVEVGAGDSLEIIYEGKVRRVRVGGVMEWGLRCWDLDKRAMRAFKFELIGRETPQETDEAAPF